MPFGEKIQAMRKQENISQEDLAEKLNTSRNTISRWETNQVMPEIETLIEISELFSVSLDYLLKDILTDADMKTINSFMPTKKLFLFVQLSI